MNILSEYIEQLLVSLGFIASFITVGVVVSRYFKYKHQERLALIEKGLDLPVSTSALHRNLSLKVLLKAGILFSGLGIGVLGGFILQNIVPGFEPPLPYMFSLPFFTGIALIVFYLISRE